MESLGLDLCEPQTGRLNCAKQATLARSPAQANVYSRETKDAANIAGVLTEDEARRIAANIAKLPTIVFEPRMSLIGSAA